jgi:hypothetical protein
LRIVKRYRTRNGTPAPQASFKLRRSASQYIV